MVTGAGPSIDYLDALLIVLRSSKDWVREQLLTRTVIALAVAHL
jgi:hypothetical protein